MLKVTSHKFYALDSLRGIAALMVIFQHFWEMNNPADSRLKPWLFFCAGHEAVILFFVLSGFVLSHQLREFCYPDYWRFLFKRWLRIYPAYYAAVLLAGGLLYFINRYHPATLAGQGLSSWFYIWSQTCPDWTLFWGSLTLLSHAGSSLDIAIWTLFYEVWLSLFFPLLRSLFYAQWWVRCLSFSVVFALSYYLWQNELLLNNSWAGIVYYGWYFIFGMLLYQQQEPLKFLAKNAILIFGLALYFSNYLMFGKITSRLTHELIISLGSAIILLNCLHHRGVKKYLALWVLRFYGRISYSLYLLHMPILSALSYLLLAKLNLLEVKTLTLLLTTFAATLSYYLIEIQFIKFARKR